MAIVLFSAACQIATSNLEPLITVFVNPTAGGNRAPDLPDRVGAAFAAAGVDARVVTLKSGDDVAAMAESATEASDAVVAGGGDGTVSAVATALAGTNTPLGVLPIGTLNHFARDMKIPGELDEAAATIAAGRITTVDMGEVNGRRFVNNSSIGVYPNVVTLREQLRRGGHRKWTAMAIAIWRVLRNYRGVRVDLDVNGRRFSARTPFVFVGNNEYVVEGLQVGAREHLASGKLFVYLAPRITTRQLPILLVRALFGRAHNAHVYEVIETTDLTIDTSSSKVVAVSLDGETTTLKMPLRYQARPGALKVIA